MPTQLSSLAVRPDLDPSKFVQGAHQLDAAASSAGKAVAGVGVASDEVNRKISQAGDVVGRLSRQYVDGYASAQRFESALNSLSREMTKGNLTINQAQPILDGIYRKYGLMGDAAQFAAKGQTELAAAITNANARLEQQRRIVPANSNSRISSGMAQAAGFNVGQQLQDVAMMAALGQSPLTMAFQQGPQIATAIEQGGGIAALRTGLASLLSPTMGITIALTAAAGAAIQFGSSIISRGKSIDDVLKGHKSFIDEITKSFPQAAAAAKQYEDQAKLLPQSVVAADTSQQIKDETEAYQKAMRDFRVQFNLLIQGDTGQADFARLGKAGVTAFAEISKGIKTGQIDAIELQRRLGELRLNPDLSKSTRDFYKALQDAVNPAAELERHMQGTEAAAKALYSGPRPLPIGSNAGAGDFDRNKALSDEQTQLSRMQRSFDAEIAAIRARSPAERRDAARLQAAATVNDSETPAERNRRINDAGQRAQIEAQHQLNEAQLQRKRSLDATLASQQLDLELIGKTAGQTEALRLQFQLTQQLREEAARNNIPVDQKELDLIKQKAEAYGKMADQIARARLRDDLSFDVAQLGRSPIDQQVAATQKQYGLAVDLNSADAATIRYALNVKKVADAWNDVRNTGMDAIDQLVGSASKGFSDIGDVASNIAGEIEHDLLQLALANPLKNAIYGAGLPTLDSIGGAGGFFGALTGKGFNPGAVPGLGQSVGAMTVQAGIVNLNGAGLTGGLTGDISRLFAPANDNSLSAYAASIRSLESSGNYGALGPTLASGDRAYGAYGIMGSNIGPWSMSALGHSLTPDQFLSSPSAQDTIFQKIFGGYLGRFGNANDAASAWFTGRPLSSGAGASDIFGTTGQSYVNQFNTNLRQMAGVTAGATDNLSNFGGGLGQLGQSLQQAATSAGGGGGIFGALGRLFGFGGGMTNLFPAAPVGAPIATGMSLADWGLLTGPPARRPAGHG